MRNSVRKYIEEQVKQITSQHIISGTPALPVGYNPIEYIRGGLFHWVLVPFNKKEVWCQLRCLNQSQLEACGDISTIITEVKEMAAGKKQPTKDEVIKVRNFQEALCRAVMNIPLFDDIGKLVGADDFVLCKKQNELKEIQKIIEKNKDELTETELADLNVRADSLELFLGYIIPTDTMDFLTWWAMGNDVTDIKKIGHSKFLEAAILADRAKGAPSDYISGVFTDHNKKDIDRHAWTIFTEYMEKKQIEQGLNKKGKGSRRFIGGPKSNKG